MMNVDDNANDNNMISNLPLLFASGYPTSLEKITESQLRRFIPFMVQCSLGYINISNKYNCSEPEWWPEDVPFVIPLVKPRHFKGDWLKKMKDIVLICYEFHKSVFLLGFCRDLAMYDQTNLRFINNCNSTISLYDRHNNKLLVTFRNENMSYDQPQTYRKSLLQRKTNVVTTLLDTPQVMVEPAPFDIYLCENCDAELYSKKAMVEHEKTCNVDIIICESPEPETKAYSENEESCKLFLSNFGLHCKPNLKNASSAACINIVISEENFTERQRLPRRNRSFQSVARCPSIPLSSPAGQQLVSTIKQNLTSDYLAERLERIERFCFTPLPLSGNLQAKSFLRKFTPNNMPNNYKNINENRPRTYLFPTRQFAQRTHAAQNFAFLNSNLITQCRPISVRLKKLPHRPVFKQKNGKYFNQKNPLENVVGTIDLCSGDEDTVINTNTQKPGKGITNCDNKLPVNDSFNTQETFFNSKHTTVNLKQFIHINKLYDNSSVFKAVDLTF